MIVKMKFLLHIRTFFFVYFCYLLYLSLADAGYSSRATAVDVEDDDSDFPTISSFVFLFSFHLLVSGNVVFFTL